MIESEAEARARKKRPTQEQAIVCSCQPVNARHRSGGDCFTRDEVIAFMRRHRLGDAQHARALMWSESFAPGRVNPRFIDTMTHVVALSGGKDSTAMALRLAEVEPREYTYICTPTGRELPEMEGHWTLLEALLGRRILRVTNGTLDSWIREWGALPNFRQRWCTRVLKIEPMMAWLLKNQPCTQYVGLRADEEDRGGIYGEVAAMTRYPLREWGWGLAEVKAYLASRSVQIPSRTDCDLCFFQRINEWKALLRRYPERYAEGERYEFTTGHTFRTPGRDSWPTELMVLRHSLERQPDLPLDDGDSDRGDMCRACSL